MPGDGGGVTDFLAVCSCHLDPLGIPDLLDFQDVVVDLHDPHRLELHVATQALADGTARFFPYATLTYPGGVIVVPQSATATRDHADAACHQLYQALTPHPVAPASDGCLTDPGTAPLTGAPRVPRAPGPGTTGILDARERMTVMSDHEPAGGHADREADRGGVETGADSTSTAIVRAAATIGDAVRRYADVTAHGAPRGQDAYAALGELKVGLDLLPEALHDTTRSLGTSLDVYDVRQDHGTDPGLHIARASDHLEHAALLLNQVWAHLDAAQIELRDQAAHPRPASS